MSSQDFQVVKRVRRVRLNPQTSEHEVVQSSTTKVRTIGSTRNGSKDKFVTSQAASSSISGRELNRDALTQVVRDRNQVPARGSANAGGNKTTQISKTTRLGIGSSGSSNSNQNSRMSGNKGMTVQTTSRFGAGATGSQNGSRGNSRDGRGNNTGLTTQSGARFGTGASGNTGLTTQTGARFGAGTTGSQSGSRGNSRDGRGGNTSLTAQTGTRFGTVTTGSGSGSRGNSRDGDNNPRGSGSRPRGGDDSKNPRGSSRDGDNNPRGNGSRPRGGDDSKNPRGSSRDENSRPGSRGSNPLPHQKSTTTKQGRSKITANYTIEGYEGESEKRMARKDIQGKLRIETEKVNIPEVFSEKNKYKSEYEEDSVHYRVVEGEVL